ncbi:MAG: hypothetical protein NT002_01155 [candidate division Zixibacteria bacterium]|nr:hypothetical protein [candidate division Zixibacteria bacterium]
MSGNEKQLNANQANAASSNRASIPNRRRIQTEIFIKTEKQSHFCHLLGTHMVRAFFHGLVPVAQT